MDVRTEQDIERLRQVAVMQEAEIGRLLTAISRLSARLAKIEGRQSQRHLELELDNLRKQLEQAAGGAGGASANQSERRNGRRGQGKGNKPQTGHGPTRQLELELVVEDHCLDDADRVCPECGGELVEFGDHADESELVDVIERRFVIRKVRRLKYICSCPSCDHRETAEAPPDQLIKGGRYALGFVTMVAVAKYLDHMPLERQVRQYGRQHLRVTTQALFDQLFALSVVLMPTYDALADHILSQSVIGLDQTSWPMLNKGRKTWQLWALTCPDAIHHRIRVRKDEATAREVLGDYAGVIVCDDFSTHNCVARDGPFRLANCGAHVRRKFIEAQRKGHNATEFLDLFDQLWAIERDTMRVDGESRADWLARRGAARNTRSRAVMAELESLLKKFGDPPVRTALRQAVEHARRVWPKLTLFLDDAEIWLDNNLTERSLRGAVMGRRNHFGSKSERGTQVAAVFYSLLESAKLCGLDPELYLRTAAQRALTNPGTVTLPHALATELAQATEV